jgi:hypothetical protein
MNIRRSIAVIGVVAVGMLGLAASSAADTGSRNEHFVALQTSTAQNATSTLIATGPVHARGTDVQISNTKDKFVFPKGTLNILHKAGHSKNAFDKVTCYGTFTETGTYKVTGGTGAYKGAHGHGNYTVKASFVGCSQTSPPDVFMLEINAFGPLAL